ncbi:MAG: AsmA-like C-terminal region-containing protein, partial [Acidobacteriota bacterium]
MRNRKNPGQDKDRPSPQPFRSVIWMAGVILVLAAAMVVVLHLPPVQQWIIDRIVNQIERATQAEVHLSSYRWWTFSRLHLEDLRIGSAGKDVIVCEKAQLSYSLSLNRPYIIPDEIVLEKPTIHLEKDPDGRWRLPFARKSPDGKPEGKEEAGRPGEPPLWLRFPLPVIRIVSGNIVGTQSGNTVLSIRDMTGTLALKIEQGPGGPSIKVDLGQWTGEAEIPRLGRWQISGDAELGGHNAGSGRIALDGLEGCRLQCEGTFSLQPPYDTDIRLNVTRLSGTVLSLFMADMPELKEVSGTLHLWGKDGGWSVEHDIQSDMGKLAGTATYRGSEPDGELQWSTRFENLKAPLGKEGPKALLTGQADLSLQGRTPQTARATLRARLDPSWVGDMNVRIGELEAAYARGGSLTVKSSGIKTSAGDFTLSAQADLAGLWDQRHEGEIRADLGIDQAALERILQKGQHRLGGKVHIEARYGAGTLKSPEKWQGKVEGDLNVPDLFALKASGNYANESVNLGYELDLKEAQRLADLLPAGWQGRGRIASKGQIKGRWPDFSWEGEIKSPRFDYGQSSAEQISIAGSGPLMGKEAKRQGTIKAQNIVADGKKLGSLQLDLQQVGESCRFQLEDRGAWPKGSLKLAGRLEHLWTPPYAVSITQGSVGWQDQTATFDSRFDVDKDHVKFHSLNLQQGKQKGQVTGELAWDSRSDLKLVLDGVDAGQWLSALGVKDLLSGTVSGQVQLNGRPEQPEGGVSLQLANGVIRSKERIEHLRLQGTLSKNTLQLQGDMVSDTLRTPARFTAKVPVRLSLKPPQLEIRKTDEWSSSLQFADLKAENVLPFLGFLDRLGGELQGEITGSGTLGQPVIKGGGTWRNGNFRVRKWPNPIEEIDAEWQADARAIYVKKARVRLLGGPVEVTGRVSYPDFDNMEWQAVGQD